MVGCFIIRLSSYLRLNVDNFLSSLKWSSYVMPAVVPAMSSACYQDFLNNAIVGRSTGNSLNDLLGDGFLWAVPKHRRSIEKRLNRKFGLPKYDWKPLRVKEHLRVCIHCNNYCEAGVLCPHCYDKVRGETKQMQEEIQKQLGLNKIEKDVVVLYENERQDMKSKDLEGKCIVEIPKKRPAWFTKNLLQKSTSETSNSTDVKLNNLA